MFLQDNYVLTVSELNDYTKKLLNSDPLLRSVTVCGELTGFKQHFSGHRYFSLKDENARVHCAMFRQDAASLDFTPQDGMKVIVQGSATLYPRDGTYQIIVHSMTRYGIGDLYARFEALKKKLGAEGLFDPSRKRALPRYPKCIGVVTSLSGAAVHDIIRVSKRRDRGIRIIIAPCAVQGSGAGEDIARAIELLNKDGRCDVLLIGRGGGSAEELWAFNEEVVARAIAASRIPTVSCVGHEVDVTISDFVADKRAATPSAAAELVVPVKDDMLLQLDTLKLRLRNALAMGQKHRRVHFETLASAMALRRPRYLLIEPRRKRLEDASRKLTAVMEKDTMRRRAKLDVLSGKLHSMDPAHVLERGYTVITMDGEYISSSKKVASGNSVDIQWADGKRRAVIADIKERDRV